MPTKRIKREREPLPVQYPAQFSIMTTPAADTIVRTIARNTSRTLSAVLREAVDLGLALMVDRGDMQTPATRARRARQARVSPNGGGKDA